MQLVKQSPKQRSLFNYLCNYKKFEKFVLFLFSSLYISIYIYTKCFIFVLLSFLFVYKIMFQPKILYANDRDFHN